MAKPRRDPPSRHMPLVSVPPGWQPPAILVIRHGLGDLPLSWWNIRAHTRRRDRPPRGFE